jgi:hypothetical protein
MLDKNTQSKLKELEELAKPLQKINMKKIQLFFAV